MTLYWALATPLQGAGRQDRKVSFRAAGARNACRPKTKKNSLLLAGRSVAVAQIWALYQTGAQPRCPARCGGHTWDAMGTDGGQRFVKGNYDGKWNCAQLVLTKEPRQCRCPMSD